VVRLVHDPLVDVARHVVHAVGRHARLSRARRIALVEPRCCTPRLSARSRRDTAVALALRTRASTRYRRRDACLPSHTPRRRRATSSSPTASGRADSDTRRRRCRSVCVACAWCSRSSVRTPRSAFSTRGRASEGTSARRPGSSRLRPPSSQKGNLP
jgi:hypothetical protein